MAEDVIAELQAVRRGSGPVPPAVEGSDDDGHVIVRLGAGGAVSCTIDQRWAQRRSDAITATLMVALSRARAQLAGRDVPARRVDGLIGDVLATLASFNDR